MDSVVDFRAPPVPDAAQQALRCRALALYALPLNDLLFEAHTVHRAHFDPNRVQRSALLSIKTGGCPEDCGYCPQAARYHTGVESQELRSEEHTSELQSPDHLVCRLLLEKKKTNHQYDILA